MLLKAHPEKLWERSPNVPKKLTSASSCWVAGWCDVLTPAGSWALRILLISAISSTLQRKTKVYM